MSKHQIAVNADVGVSFASCKDAIIKAINTVGLKKAGIRENVSMVDGFVTLHNEEFFNEQTVGGKYIPSVVLVGDSGRLYFFAVRSLLPNIGKGIKL